MSTVSDIESAVRQLSASELLDFRKWFFEYDADAWDKQLKEDVAAGKLEALGHQALKELRQGRCTEL